MAVLKLMALELERAEIAAEINTLRSALSEEAADIKAVRSAKAGDAIDGNVDGRILLCGSSPAYRRATDHAMLTFGYYANCHQIFNSSDRLVSCNL